MRALTSSEAGREGWVTRGRALHGPGPMRLPSKRIPALATVAAMKDGVLQNRYQDTQTHTHIQKEVEHQKEDGCRGGLLVASYPSYSNTMLRPPGVRLQNTVIRRGAKKKKRTKKRFMDGRNTPSVLFMPPSLHDRFSQRAGCDRWTRTRLLHRVTERTTADPALGLSCASVAQEKGLRQRRAISEAQAHICTDSNPRQSSVAPPGWLALQWGIFCDGAAEQSVTYVHLYNMQRRGAAESNAQSGCLGRLGRLMRECCGT